jgi:hypothetical protein
MTAQIDIIIIVMSVLNVTILVLPVVVELLIVVPVVMLQDSYIMDTVLVLVQEECMEIGPLKLVNGVILAVLIVNKCVMLSCLLVILSVLNVMNHYILPEKVLVNHIAQMDIIILNIHLKTVDHVYLHVKHVMMPILVLLVKLVMNS